MGSGLRFALSGHAGAAALALGAGCGGAPASGPLVFGAASTADVLEAAADAFADGGGVRPRFSFAASSTLARQLAAGAPAELVVLADPTWMDALEQAQLLEPGSRADWAAGSLVWIAPRGATVDVDWSSVTPPAFEGRLALGDPDHVPAGTYAREALLNLGWWTALSERLAPAVDVRAALRLVELGEAGAGLVYSTDARASEHVESVSSVPPELHAPVRYPAALARGAGGDAAAFLAFLRGAEGRALLREHGFELAAPAALSRGGR